MPFSRRKGFIGIQTENVSVESSPTSFKLSSLYLKVAVIPSQSKSFEEGGNPPVANIHQASPSEMGRTRQPMRSLKKPLELRGLVPPTLREPVSPSTRLVSDRTKQPGNCVANNSSQELTLVVFLLLFIIRIYFKEDSWVIRVPKCGGQKPSDELPKCCDMILLSPE